MDEDERAMSPVVPYTSEEQLRAILHKIARAWRSPCFWWFFDHYDGMRDAEGKLRMTWRECCASLTALGITAMNGRPLTPETTRRTWKKVVEKKTRDAARGVQCSYVIAEVEKAN